ncbi:UNVERIFIED_CONTAM: hypothetical protein K2H54_061241 [Gekko kuhli]
MLQFRSFNPAAYHLGGDIYLPQATRRWKKQFVFEGTSRVGQQEAVGMMAVLQGGGLVVVVDDDGVAGGGAASSQCRLLFGRFLQGLSIIAAECLWKQTGGSEDKWGGSYCDLAMSWSLGLTDSQQRDRSYPHRPPSLEAAHGPSATLTLGGVRGRPKQQRDRWQGSGGSGGQSIRAGPTTAFYDDRAVVGGQQAGMGPPLGAPEAMRGHRIRQSKWA